MGKIKQPKCKNCWDKGYSSELIVHTQHADFIGEKTYSGTLQRKNFCNCAKGKRLSKKNG